MDTQLKDFRTFITNLRESLTITKRNLEKINQKETRESLEEKGLGPNTLRNVRREIQIFHEKINILKLIISDPNQPISIQKTQGISKGQVPPLPSGYIIATKIQHPLRARMKVQIVREKSDGGGLEWSDGWLLDEYNESNNTWIAKKYVGPDKADLKYEDNIPLDNIAVLLETII